MRAIQIRKTGGPEVLELVELPVPRPGADQVLVPDTLLTAIYWRFSAEVSADSRNPIRRRCDNPECANEFVGRPNRKHCTEYCGNRLRDLKRDGRAPNL